MNLLALGLALWLASMPVVAEDLRVMDLHLRPDVAWLRGSPQQEQEDEALVLSWPVAGGMGLQLLVPREPPLIKSDADTFYRNLTRKWSALYGKRAAVGWMDGGRDGQDGVRWLSCRRPAGSGDGVVFHLATVHEGRAYSLLLFAPPGTDALPEAAARLVMGADFQLVPTVWRRTRSLLVAPQADALEALAQAEADALGDKGMITGYGIDLEAPPLSGADTQAGGAGVSWFLDGFRWDKNLGRDGREAFDVRGRMVAWGPGVLGEAPLRVALHVGGTETGVALRVEAHAYCGGEGPWREAMAALERGLRGPLSRLGREHACAGQAQQVLFSGLETAPGRQLEQSVPLAPPTGKVDKWWLEVRPQPGTGAIGEGVLDRLGAYFVYEPGR